MADQTDLRALVKQEVKQQLEKETAALRNYARKLFESGMAELRESFGKLSQESDLKKLSKEK